MITGTVESNSQTSEALCLTVSLVLLVLRLVVGNYDYRYGGE